MSSCHCRMCNQMGNRKAWRGRCAEREQILLYQSYQSCSMSTEHTMLMFHMHWMTFVKMCSIHRCMRYCVPQCNALDLPFSDVKSITITFLTPYFILFCVTTMKHVCIVYCVCYQMQKIYCHLHFSTMKVLFCSRKKRLTRNNNIQTLNIRDNSQ